MIIKMRTNIFAIKTFM